MLELNPTKKAENALNTLGRCPKCGARSWVQGTHFTNNIDCKVCGLGLLLDYDDSTAKAWAKEPVKANITVIDWDSLEERDKLYEHFKESTIEMAKAGRIRNLQDESIFLAGITTFYSALGKAGLIPSAFIRPGLCHDSAYNIDYYDDEHPLRHCKDCGEKMWQRRVVDPDEIARKVRPSRQKGKLVWTCPKCHNDSDAEDFPARLRR